MSSNLAEKDKIILLSAAGGSPQKVSLDPTDSAKIMDYFARLQPGDEVSFEGKATLDEAGQKNITLSITEFKVNDIDEDEASPAPPPDGVDEDMEENKTDSGEPAGVEMLKNDDGVPENEDNLPPDTMPSH